MKNKGYTIMEAVIAMFLIVVMVGAVFSALMSGRRAIVTSTDKEDILYSIQSAYGMLKDCRSNTENCYLHRGLNCNYTYSASNQSLAECNHLFTFGFGHLCRGANAFQYNVTDVGANAGPKAHLKGIVGNVPGDKDVILKKYITLDIQAYCQESA